MGRRLLNILRIILKHGPQALEKPEDRTRVEDELLAQGFHRGEIERAFDWFGHARGRDDFLSRIEPLISGSSPMPGEISGGAVVSLSDSAHHFLFSLKELGLIDDEMEEEILNRVMIGQDSEIDLSAMKRIAATVIFEQQFDGSEEYSGIFDEEWRLLFS